MGAAIADHDDDAVGGVGELRSAAKRSSLTDCTLALARDASVFLGDRRAPFEQRPCLVPPCCALVFAEEPGRHACVPVGFDVKGQAQRVVNTEHSL
jgi:hypothetical protein